MFIVADIGGTKMRVAGSRELQTFSEPSIGRTPENYDEGLAHFIKAAKMIAGENQIERIAVGFPGVLARNKRHIERSEHLQGWAGRNFADDVESALQTHMVLENDTALVGLGEAVFGAGKGASIVAYVTVSTGLNGARIVDGKLEPCVFGFEIGGQYLSYESELVTFEELVSGDAIHRREGKHPRDLGKEWSGWEDLARVTAIGVHNTIVHWSPERVILGGSMLNDIGISVDAVKSHLAEIMRKFPTIPDIVHSQLKDEGGLYGGLARLQK
ncbi:MAG TPA: ROK family protein [Candidatus Paceibacterota bacterium]|nr:ROK family protein [Candidatus Paceibacterota bacterium]